MRYTQFVKRILRLTLSSVLVISLTLSSVFAQPIEIQIQLVPGWNQISINVIPPDDMFVEGRAGPDVPQMFNRVRDPFGELLTVMVVDGMGRFYYPAFDFNNIPFWNLQRGLWVLVEEPVPVVWEGIRIDADAEMQIISGWNLIAYYPAYQLNAHNDEFYVISEILDDVIHAIDGQGGFILPEFNFSNMNPWQQGKGYLIKLRQDENNQRIEFDFNYPEEREEEELVWFEPGDHWEIPIVSREPMSLLVNEIEGPDGFEPDEGDQIAAFTENGDLTGLGDVHDGVCGLVIWGEDNQNDENVFVGRDEGFTLLYWDDDQDAELEVNVEDVVEGNGLRFFTYSFSVVEISVDAGDLVFDLEVPLNEGWNLISINVIPPEEMWENEQGPDIRLMTEQLRIDEDNHRVILMKNNEGQFYTPEFDFNSIPYWDLEEGYMVKVDEDVMAVWTGGRIAPDADINLETGWNMIAYYPTYELDASDPDFYVLSTIIDHVLIAKDGIGRFMIPEFEFSNMPPWRETLGYKVKMDEDDVLNYPSEQEEENDAFRGVEELGTNLTPTGINMSLLILGLQSNEGELLKAVNFNNITVGQGFINLDGKCGLAIWGDDPTTLEKDGLLEGEAFGLWLSEEVLEPTMYHAGKDLTFEADGFIVIDAALQAIVPSEYYLSAAYPNPFNNRTLLRYGLPKAGIVEINLYDISGRHVKDLGRNDKTAGNHNLELNASEMGSGLFLVRMEVNGFRSVRKIVLMK